MSILDSSRPVALFTRRCNGKKTKHLPCLKWDIFRFINRNYQFGLFHPQYSNKSSSNFIKKPDPTGIIRHHSGDKLPKGYIARNRFDIDIIVIFQKRFQLINTVYIVHNLQRYKKEITLQPSSYFLFVIQILLPECSLK